MKSFVLLCSVFLVLLSENASANITTVSGIEETWGNYAYSLNAQDSLRLTGRWGTFFPFGCGIGNPCPPSSDAMFFDTLQFRNAVYIDMSDLNHTSFGYQNTFFTILPTSFQGKAPNLRHIILPSHLTYLNPRQFAGEITSEVVHLRNRLEVVEFKEIVNPHLLTEVPDSAFLNVLNLRRYDGLKYAEIIGIDAFHRVGGFTKIELPVVRHIKTNAFRAARLDSIIIGPNIEKIDAGAFHFNALPSLSQRVFMTEITSMPEICATTPFHLTLNYYVPGNPLVSGSLAFQFRAAGFVNTNRNYFTTFYAANGDSLARSALRETAENRTDKGPALADFPTTAWEYHWHDVNGDRWNHEEPLSRDTSLFARPVARRFNITYRTRIFERPLTNGNVEEIIPNPAGNPQTFTIECEIPLFAPPERAGYEFIGWERGVEPRRFVEGRWVDATYDTISTLPKGLVGELTLTALWKLIEYPLNLHFNLPQALLSDERGLTLSGASFLLVQENYDYFFSEEIWTDFYNVGNLAGSNNYTVEVLTINAYSNLLDGSGLAITDLRTSINLGLYIPRLSADGYEFGGWFDNAEFNGEPLRTREIVLRTWVDNRTRRDTLTYYRAASLGDIGEKNFFARWLLKEYTISFETDGGSSLNDIRFNIESPEITLPVPQRPHSVFAGWGGNGLCEDGKVLLTGNWGDRTLVAKWTAAHYPIILNDTFEVFDNGRYQFSEENAFTLPNADDILPFGFSFVGWFDNERLIGMPISQIPAGSFGEIEFWAKWDTTHYEVEFVSNSQLTIPNAVFTFWDFCDSLPKPEAKLPVPELSGWKFTGWFADEDLSAAAITHWGGVEWGKSKTVFAAWERYTPSFIRNRESIDSRYGILLENAIVSDFARISIITPEPAIANVRIFDNLGNVVWTANDVRAYCIRPAMPDERTTMNNVGDLGVCKTKFRGAERNNTPLQNAVIWNLTNPNGRFVANGTYIIIAETTGISGRIYRYSARLGVRR